MGEPTIIMVGGEVELYGGAKFDTRQRVASDEWDATQRAACFRSEEWWTKAVSVARAVLAEPAGEDPTWALLWAPKSLYVTQPNGDVKRKGLNTFLGKGASADLMKFDSEHWQDGIRYEETDATWRILEHKLRFEDLVGTTGPAVFVGSGHDTTLLTESFRSKGKVKHVAPFDPVDALMGKRLVAVLPDTPILRRHVDAYLAFREGRPWDAPAIDDWEDYDALSEVSKLINDTRPPVIAADFRVTRWIDQGAESSPEHLEAALDFKETRFDIDVGLWDLARDPILRDTLLEATPTPSPTHVLGEAPAEVQEAVQELRQDREDDTNDMLNSRARIDDTLRPLLLGHGEWQPGGDPGERFASFRLPIGDDYPHQWDHRPAPLLEYRLETMKTHARLKLVPVALPSHHEDEVTEFLEDQTELIRQATGRKPSAKDHRVASFKGYGWNDEPEDRAAFLRDVANVVEALRQPVEDLHRRLHESHTVWHRDHVAEKEREAAEQRQRDEELRERGIRVTRSGMSVSFEFDLPDDEDAMQAPASEPKKGGFLRRLFGGG